MNICLEDYYQKLESINFKPVSIQSNLSSGDIVFSGGKPSFLSSEINVYQKWIKVIFSLQN